MPSTTASGRKTRTTGKTARSPKKTASAARTGAGRTSSKRESASKDRSGADGMHVRTAHATIPIPYVTGKDISDNVRAAGSALPDVKLPPPERMAFYGGLGALAAVGVVEWPVAAAIGAAAVVARRSRREKR